MCAQSRLAAVWIDGSATISLQRSKWSCYSFDSYQQDSSKLILETLTSGTNGLSQLVLIGTAVIMSQEAFVIHCGVNLSVVSTYRICMYIYDAC